VLRRQPLVSGHVQLKAVEVGVQMASVQMNGVVIAKDVTEEAEDGFDVPIADSVDTMIVVIIVTTPLMVSVRVEVTELTDNGAESEAGGAGTISVEL
jgi:hypothetical protein